MLTQKDRPANFNVNPFKVQGGFGGDKIVSAYLPWSMANLLALIAVREGTSISNLLGDIVNRYVTENESEETTIRVLASRAHNEWVRRLTQFRGRVDGWRNEKEIATRYREYQDEMKIALQRRRVIEPNAVQVVQTMELMYGLGGKQDNATNKNIGSGKDCK